MKSGQPSFAENDTAGGVFKGSLFKTLFSDRKRIIEGYPAVKKGLQFPDPCLKFGNCNYTFKSNDVVDKISAKHGDSEFAARFKKNSNLWDLSYKCNVAKNTNALVKYEERGSGGPNYVVGADTVFGMFLLNSKFQLATGVVKSSFLANLDDQLKGLKVAGDFCTNVRDMSSRRYNIGASYLSPFGTTVLAFNDSQIMTANQTITLDNKTSALMEVAVQAGAKKPTSPIVLGVSHKYDRQHEVRARVNQAGQVQLSVKKDVTPNVSLLMATCLDVNRTEGLAAPPAFGFKVVTKGN